MYKKYFKKPFLSDKNRCSFYMDKFDDLGLEALDLGRQQTYRKVSVKKSEDMIKKLQAHLPKRQLHPYTILIWALPTHPTSYPIWYKTLIAGLNLRDLKITNLSRLIKYTKMLVDAIESPHEK